MLGRALWVAHAKLRHHAQRDPHPISPDEQRHPWPGIKPAERIAGMLPRYAVAAGAANPVISALTSHRWRAVAASYDAGEDLVSCRSWK